jgi:GMP synthase (glutamine-hydrolysing)
LRRHFRPWFRVISTFLVAVALSGCSGALARPIGEALGLVRTPTPRPTHTPTATFTPRPTHTYTSTPTPTATPTSTPTSTPTPTWSPTATSTPTPTPTPSPTPSPTETPTPAGPPRAAVILHGPSRFLAVDDFVVQNGFESVPILFYDGEEVPDLTEFDAVVLSGGETPPSEFDKPAFQQEWAQVQPALEAGVPILGICLGHQLLAHWVGGQVERGPTFEVGWLPVTLTGEASSDPLLAGFEGSFDAFLWHRDAVTELPEGAILLGSSDQYRVQVFRLGEWPAWGVQFSPQYGPRKAERLFRGSTWLEKLGYNLDELSARGYETYDGLGERLFANFFAVALERRNAGAGGP